jgi:hypothetical protein
MENGWNHLHPLCDLLSPCPRSFGFCFAIGKYLKSLNNWKNHHWTYHRLCNKSITTGVTAGAGIIYPSWASELASGFYLFLWGSYCSCCKITYFGVYRSVLWSPLCFPRKNVVRFIATPMYFVVISCFIYIICIYLRILVSNTISISDDVRIF